MNSRRLLELINELRAELEAAATERDAFAHHVFQSRRLYRRTPMPVSKSRRGSQAFEYVICKTYQEAKQLGYLGTEREWLHILGAGDGATGSKSLHPSR